MSARASITGTVVAAICAVIALGVAAGWDSASRGELIVLHLGSE
ncbi:hypothetical protein [Methylobacterium radiodurans]|nr:hypothetical protein [Methylobacterium radiodurans]